MSSNDDAYSESNPCHSQTGASVVLPIADAACNDKVPVLGVDKHIDQNTQNEDQLITNLSTVTEEVPITGISMCSRTHGNLPVNVVVNQHFDTILQFGLTKVDIHAFLKLSRVKMRKLMCLADGHRDHLILTALSIVDPEKTKIFYEILSLTKEELITRLGCNDEVRW